MPQMGHAGRSGFMEPPARGRGLREREGIPYLRSLCPSCQGAMGVVREWDMKSPRSERRVRARGSVLET